MLLKSIWALICVEAMARQPCLSFVLLLLNLFLAVWCLYAATDFADVQHNMHVEAVHQFEEMIEAQKLEAKERQ